MSTKPRIKDILARRLVLEAEAERIEKEKVELAAPIKARLNVLAEIGRSVIVKTLGPENTRVTGEFAKWVDGWILQSFTIDSVKAIHSGKYQINISYPSKGNGGEHHKDESISSSVLSMSDRDFAKMIRRQVATYAQHLAEENRINEKKAADQIEDQINKLTHNLEWANHLVAQATKHVERATVYRNSHEERRVIR